MTFGLVASIGAGSGGGATTSPDQNTVGGNLAILTADGVGVATPIDSYGNVYTNLLFDTYGGVDMALYYCGGGNLTVGTAHNWSTQSSPADVVASVFSGAAALSPLDGVQYAAAGALGNSGGQAVGPIVPSVNGCLVFTGFSGTEANIIIPSGFTLSTGGFGWIGWRQAYLEQATAASIAPAWSWDFDFQFYMLVVASFLPGSSPPAAQPPYNPWPQLGPILAQ